MASVTRSFARAAAFKLTPSTSAFRTSVRRTAFNVSRQNFREQARRGYASEPVKSSSSTLLYGALALFVAGSGGFYFYNQNASAIAKAVVAATKEKPFVPGPEDYQKVYDAVAALLADKDEYEDGSYGPILIRLAWHASGTYDKETGTGGSNGATMRFSPEGSHLANAGLNTARNFLEPIKAQFPWISYSDLWILAAVCAIQEMQGPAIPFRGGRVDADATACTPDGRLPDGKRDQKHLRDIFYRMGFNDQEIVALAGPHSLGRCHKQNSGFEGPWTFSPTIVSNEFYRLLLGERWGVKKWDGNKQYEDKTTKSLMMLPTDMSFVSDKGFRPWVEKYAKDQNLFFKDFAAVITRLFELGVTFPEDSQPLILRPMNL